MVGCHHVGIGVRIIHGGNQGPRAGTKPFPGGKNQEGHPLPQVLDVGEICIVHTFTAHDTLGIVRAGSLPRGITPDIPRIKPSKMAKCHAMGGVYMVN